MKHLHISVVMLLVLSSSCGLEGKSPAQVDNPISDSTKAPPETALSLIREQVDVNPVATYTKKVEDDLNDWYFKVQLFQTAERFSFKVSMQFQEVTGEDVISIPNLGVEPKVEVKPGSKKYSCIIGFVDKEGTFREFKEVSVQNDVLKITTLKYYTVTK